jgi:multimeric flavodoxin WrbA
MRATMLNCTLKPSPEESNTQKSADHVLEALANRGVSVEVHRLVDLDIKPGVETEMGDDWTGVHQAIVGSEILIIGTPTWLGQPSSIAKKALERMDAMLSETDDEGRPVAYNKVAGVVVTGNEDGAHHVISQISGALIDIGFTVPGQSWTYWNRGPGPGPTYGETNEGHDWSHKAGRAMAANLVTVSEALATQPMQAPPE